MRVKLNASAVRQTKWYEYAVRFIFGGVITAMTGIIAKKFGAGIGGLFLAFPAIFPAAATLIEKHEKQKKQQIGSDGSTRGRNAVAIYATGTARGTLGLLVFATAVWRFLPRYPTWIVLLGGTLAWFVVSATVWHIRSHS